MDQVSFWTKYRLGPSFVLDQVSFWTKFRPGPSFVLEQVSSWSKYHFGPSIILDQVSFWTKLTPRFHSGKLASDRTGLSYQLSSCIIHTTGPKKIENTSTFYHLGCGSQVQTGIENCYRKSMCGFNFCSDPVQSYAYFPEWKSAFSLGPSLIFGTKYRLVNVVSSRPSIELLHNYILVSAFTVSILDKTTTT